MGWIENADKMTPVPLQDWFMANRAKDEMLWKGAAEDQIMFVRDKLQGLLGAGMAYEDRKQMAMVISTHRSKSIALPVYRLHNPLCGLTVVLRENFYNWKLSVISEKPIIADFSPLFYTTSPVEPDYTGSCLHPVYFEGFPGDLIFGYYAESDKKKWSAEIGGDFALWTTLFMIMSSLGALKPRTWHTRESHRAELDAEHAEWSKKFEAEKERERAQKLAALSE